MTAARSAHWVQAGWGHKVGGVDELMRAISRIGTLQTGRTYVWRGVADHRWHVRSTLVRRILDAGLPLTESAVRESERELLSRAREWGIGTESTGLASDLHVLAILQHHGAPTRLLDVTRNPMTALWFACWRANTSGNDASGALFAFEVTGLPRTPTTIAPAHYNTYNGQVDPLSRLLDQSADVRQAFLVEPSLPDPRMLAQEGLFITASVPAGDAGAGVDGLPLLTGPAPGGERLARLFAPQDRTRGRPSTLPFAALIIEPRLKARARSHLESTYNRTHRRLFPDVPGFVADLRETWAPPRPEASVAAQGDLADGDPRPCGDGAIAAAVARLVLRAAGPRCPPVG